MRAASAPRPNDWVEPDLEQHDEHLAMFLAKSAACYFTDISEFQPPYSKVYPYPLASFRFHSGYKLDNHAVANWAYHKKALASGKTKVLFLYAVFVPGQLSLVMTGLKQLLGQKCPSNRIVLMVDMESGREFAGPGNHSVEANRWAAAFAEYVGSWDRVMPYANAPDFSSCWPQLHPNLDRKHIAAYRATEPVGAYAWQYYGGVVDNPSPPGAPRSCAGFGAYVDLNVIYKTVDQIEHDFGITAPVVYPPLPPTPHGEDDMANPSALYEVDMTGAPDGTPTAGTWVHYQYTGVYMHVEPAVKNTDNVDALEHAGASSVIPITYAQHMGFLAARTNGAQS